MPIRMLGPKGGGFDRESHIDWRKEQVEVILRREQTQGGMPIRMLGSKRGGFDRGLTSIGERNKLRLFPEMGRHEAVCQ